MPPFIERARRSCCIAPAPCWRRSASRIGCACCGCPRPRRAPGVSRHTRSPDLRVSLDSLPRAISGPTPRPAISKPSCADASQKPHCTIRITSRIIPEQAPPHNLEWQGNNAIGQSLVPPGLDAEREGAVLRDGSWAKFDFTLPQVVYIWPYHLLASLFILLSVILLLSLIAVRLATRPLLVLAEAAEDLGKNINHPPLAEQGSVEVRRAAPEPFKHHAGSFGQLYSGAHPHLAAMSRYGKHPSPACGCAPNCLKMAS